MNTPGECRVCHCSGDCTLRNGDECCWKDAACTLCTNDACLIADARQRSLAAAVSKQKKQKQPRYGPWRVIKRDASGRAIHIVRTRNFNQQRKGRAA